MRQNHLILIAILGLVAAVAVLVGPKLLGENDAPILRFDHSDEVVVEADTTIGEADPADAFGNLSDAGRSEVAITDLPAEERTELLLRGRVVDRYRNPVAGARVWLGYARGGPRDRGGRQRQVPEPITTDRDGQFAFAGEMFRNLRVTLSVAHADFAPRRFDRDLGEVANEADLGELAMTGGAEFVGRVTDLGGNSVVGATVELQAQGRVNLDLGRQRAELLPTATTDQNGYYSFPHVAAGDWRVAAAAPNHQRGRSESATAAEDARVELEDIRLGPGFAIAGIVSDQHGAPIAKASVSIQPSTPAAGSETAPGPRGQQRGRGRAGRGGFQLFMGNEFSTTTDEQGRFVIDHLPGDNLDVVADKAGYLRARHAGLDPQLGQPVYLKLLDGLRLGGVVTDAVTGAPVTTYRVTVQQVRGLDEEPSPWGQFVRGNVRINAGGGVMFGGDDQGRGQSSDQHDDGAFLETGLEQGIYTVSIESPDHAPYRSDEIELRLGTVQPHLQIRVERGYAIRGVVRDHESRGVVDARVELRAARDPAAEPPMVFPGGRGFGNVRWPQQTVRTVQTDARGAFAIEHVAGGRYEVSASAERRARASTEPFALTADVDGIDLVLGALGSIAGKVLGAGDLLADVRIMAVPGNLDMSQVFRGRRPTITPDADGNYRIDDLEPGAWYVRAVVGNGFRPLLTEFMGDRPPAPDVVVAAERVADYNVTVTLPQVGVVRGSVLHNGQPAAGMRVSLRQVNDNGGGGFGGGFGGRWGGNLRATVDADGRFEIGDVDAGTWQLLVSADDGSGSLHSETVVVFAGNTSEITVSLATASLRGVVTTADGTSPRDLTGTVELLPGLTELPADLRAWRRENTTFRTNVRDGRFAIDRLPPGPYLAVVRIRERVESQAQVQANLGAANEVQLPAGAR